MNLKTLDCKLCGTEVDVPLNQPSVVCPPCGKLELRKRDIEEATYRRTGRRIVVKRIITSDPARSRTRGRAGKKSRKPVPGGAG